jgi:hypothetical protein
MRRDITAGLIFIAIGTIMLLSNLGIIPGNLKDWWPIILVAIGIGIILDKN